MHTKNFTIEFLSIIYSENFCFIEKDNSVDGKSDIRVREKKTEFTFVSNVLKLQMFVQIVV